MNNLATNIKHLRKQHKLSQQSLGDLIGSSQTSVAHYERGSREPTIDKLIEISKVLNENVDFLIGNVVYNQNTVSIPEKKDDITSLLLEALLNKDDRLFSDLFTNHVFGLYELSYILDVILRDILYNIGTLWDEGNINEADEHYASNQVRKVINYISVMNMNNIKSKSAISFAVGSEKHTIGVEMVNTYLESLGVQSIYLGTNLPYRSIENTINDYKPDFIFISITMSDNINSLNQLIDYINLKTNKEIQIVIGGQGYTAYKNRQPYANVTYIKSLKELDNIIT